MVRKTWNSRARTIVIATAMSRHPAAAAGARLGSWNSAGTVATCAGAFAAAAVSTTGGEILPLALALSAFFAETALLRCMAPAAPVGLVNMRETMVRLRLRVEGVVVVGPAL